MRNTSPPVRSRAGLIAAAGQGLRLGHGPKALLRVAGLTLLERAVSALAPVVDEVIVAVPSAEVTNASALVPHARVIAGAATRQETVYELVRSTESDLVLVHDVARPFLPASVAVRVLGAATRSGAASAVRSVADTLVRHPGGEPVERVSLRAVQTPQAFRRELLLSAHEAARRGGLEATDDAALIRAAGGEVELVEGSPWLFKLTVADDLAFAEALAGGWEAYLEASRRD